MSSSTRRSADARRPFSVAAPAAEIELEGHVVELGKLRRAGNPAPRPRLRQRGDRQMRLLEQRPSLFMTNWRVSTVAAPHFFRKNWTAEELYQFPCDLVGERRAGGVDATQARVAKQTLDPRGGEDPEAAGQGRPRDTR